MTGEWVANAPVSFGVWGPHHGPAGSRPIDVLDGVARSGYTGSELGPTGYLGDPAETAAAFAGLGLAPAGVYVGVPLAAGVLGPDARAGLELACRTLAATTDAARRAGSGAPAGPIVLADDGAAELADAPRDWTDRSAGLDAERWAGAVRVLTEAHRVITDHGLPASFHPHLATWVENRWEVDRLLQTTALGVTLDTGHLQLAGADPIDCLRDWRERVDHVHLKDIRSDVVATTRAAGPTVIRDWWGRACVPLGTGEVDLVGFWRELVAQGYGGWVVVEQDHQPRAEADLPVLVTEQQANARYVAGLRAGHVGPR